MAEDTPASRPPPPKPSFMRTLMFMMVFLTLFVLFDEGLRNAFGQAVGAVFNPLIGFGAAYPVLTILLAGSFTTVVSSLVRHVFTDWVKMTRFNKQMTALRKASMEALRRGNPGKVQKLREAQLNLQKEFMDVQFAPMKSMAFTFLFFIVFFSWLSTFVYVDVASAGHVQFAVPWSYAVDLRNFYVLPAWILLYSLLAIPIGQIVSRLLRYLSFRKRLASLGAQDG